MYIPVNLENVKVLCSNFNVPIFMINDDFIEVFDFDHIKLSYIFDGVKLFNPVIECKAFNTKNFVLGIMDGKTDFTPTDDFYFSHFCEKYSISINDKIEDELLVQKIVKLYFEVVKCIKYELQV